LATCPAPGFKRFVSASLEPTKQEHPNNRLVELQQRWLATIVLDKGRLGLCPYELWEPTMTKTSKTAKAWTKPQVTRLGELKDVRAGNTGTTSNAAMS